MISPGCPQSDWEGERLVLDQQKTSQPDPVDDHQHPTTTTTPSPHQHRQDGECTPIFEAQNERIADLPQRPGLPKVWESACSSGLRWGKGKYRRARRIFSS